MHHLRISPLREVLAFTKISYACQTQVRFFALPQVSTLTTHRCLCGPPPIPLRGFNLCGRDPQSGELNALAAALIGSNPDQH